MIKFTVWLIIIKPKQLKFEMKMLINFIFHIKNKTLISSDDELIVLEYTC